MDAPLREQEHPDSERGLQVGGVIALILLSIVLAAAVGVFARSYAEVTFVVGVPVGWFLGPPEIRAVHGGPMAIERLLGRLLAVPLAVVVLVAIAVTLLLLGAWPLWVVASLSGVGLGVVGGFLARILLRLQWVTGPPSAT